MTEETESLYQTIVSDDESVLEDFNNDWADEQDTKPKRRTKKK